MAKELIPLEGTPEIFFSSAIFTPNIHLHQREVTMTKTTVSKKQYADSRDFMTSLLFRKWTIAIILSLGAETKRYSALHRSLPGVTQKVLTEHLKQLERAGIVRRFFYPTIPPRVEYELTKTGLELLKLTGDITTWFDSHSETLHKSQKTYNKKRVTVLRRL